MVHHNFNKLKVAIVTHRSLMPCIPGDDLKKFFSDRGCKSLTYVTHPLLYLKESYEFPSQFAYYKKSKLISTIRAYHWKLPEAFAYIKDFIYSIYWILRSRQKYDLYFGINNLNALSGLVLKRLGKVKKVIYYTIDLFPQRFENRFINWLYHKVDKFCVKFSDATWNVSPFIAEYRLTRDMSGKDYSREFTVPIGIWYNQMERVSTNQVKKTKIVYVGHLIDFMGVDLAIRALPLIVQKIPNIKLEIVGGGEQLEELQRLSNKLSVKKYIKFYGWKEKKEAERIIFDGALGLAPFNTSLLTDEKIKNADPAKIKDYLALGLPVIITNATVNASEIEKEKCGIIIDFSPESLANAVIKLLLDDKLRKEYRKNALKYAKQFDWNIIFDKNISRLLS